MPARLTAISGLPTELPDGCLGSTVAMPGIILQPWKLVWPRFTPTTQRSRLSG